MTKNRTYAALTAILTLAIGLLVGRLSHAAPEEPHAGAPGAAVVQPLDPVARGEYLVLTSSCHDCHTPLKMGSSGPEPDMERALSGHPEDLALPPAPPASGPWIGSMAASMTAWSGPWGTSFTANLTPDPETGTGTWSEEDFVRTIRTGRHLGSGRQILPPMPIPVYQNFTDEDLGAMYQYLRSVKPIRNRVPQPLPPG